MSRIVIVILINYRHESIDAWSVILPFPSWYLKAGFLRWTDPPSKEP
jgi:hypothetical protein